MDFELGLQCMECFKPLGRGPLRPATVAFLNTLAAEHVCAGTAAPQSGVMTADEIQALIDADKKTSS